MSKHTPGPWKWDGNVWSYDKDNEAPWLMANNQTVKILGGEIECPNKADARLIAAAPQLYDELFRALAVITNPQAFDVEGVRNDIQRVLKLAEGAE